MTIDVSKFLSKSYNKMFSWSKKSINAGWQHIKNYTTEFKSIPKTIDILELKEKNDILFYIIKH